MCTLMYLCSCDGSTGALSLFLVATHRFPKHWGSPTSVGTRKVQRRYIEATSAKTANQTVQSNERNEQSTELGRRLI